MRTLLLATPLLLLLAACGSGAPGPGPSPTPTAPQAASPQPAERTPADANPAGDRFLYIALGDSLSAGRIASDPARTAFVPLVHQGLGGGFDLLNLGRSGDTSDDLLRDGGPLDRAIEEVRSRNGDDNPDNDVKLVTLEIGGNDLLNLFFELVLTGICPNLNQSLQKPECVDPLVEALDGFRANFRIALDRLREADPDLTVIVMTLYDPFSGGLRTISEIAAAALEGLPDDDRLADGVNTIIRGEAAQRDFIVVDWYPLFIGKANEYIATDLIHPNDAGHAVMAEAILDAIADLDL